MYEIPCFNCEKTYIGETARQLSTRVKEHKDDVVKNTGVISTRSQRKQSETEVHKSAITDHAKSQSHVINWDGTKIKNVECNDTRRGIREAIQIRKCANNMNRDEGRYFLSHTYDVLLKKNTGGGPETLIRV